MFPPERNLAIQSAKRFRGAGAPLLACFILDFRGHLSLGVLMYPPSIRLLLFAGFAIIVPIGIWHRLQARTGEKLDRRQEGLFILVTLRLGGLATMAGFIAYLIWSKRR